MESGEWVVESGEKANLHAAWAVAQRTVSCELLSTHYPLFTLHSSLSTLHYPLPAVPQPSAPGLHLLQHLLHGLKRIGMGGLEAVDVIGVSRHGHFAAEAVQLLVVSPGFQDVIRRPKLL